MKCEYCGAPLLKSTKICPYCKQVNDEYEEKPLVKLKETLYKEKEDNNASNKKSLLAKKIISLILCITLGYFGVHKFFEGKIGMGMLYILTCGFFGIGVIIDSIMYIFSIISIASKKAN